MRNRVVLPQPDGPKQRDQRAGLGGDGYAVERDEPAESLRDVFGRDAHFALLRRERLFVNFHGLLTRFSFHHDLEKHRRDGEHGQH